MIRHTLRDADRPLPLNQLGSRKPAKPLFSTQQQGGRPSYWKHAPVKAYMLYRQRQDRAVGAYDIIMPKKQPSSMTSEPEHPVAEPEWGIGDSRVQKKTSSSLI